jgi:hypothetical protein
LATFPRDAVVPVPPEKIFIKPVAIPLAAAVY